MGIVASRLVQRFEKPAIVMSIEKGIAKGSARSVGEVSIYDLIQTQAKLLQKFGGHTMAAGLSLDANNLEAFRTNINIEAEKIPQEAFIPKQQVLGEMQSSAIDFELLDILEQFEPFGEANPRPRFLAEDAHIVSIRKMGKEKEHAKIELRLDQNDAQTYDMIYFYCDKPLHPGQKISCSYTLNKNVFNGQTSIQFMLEKLIG